MRGRRILIMTAAAVVILTMGVGPVFAWHITNTSTGYRDATGSFVAATTIPSGQLAVDSATVDPVSGCSSGTSCGFVVYTLYDDATCGVGDSSATTRTDTESVTPPISSGSTETVYSKGFVVAAGSWSFSDTWVFNAGYGPQSVGFSCEPFNVPSSAPEFPLGMAALMLVAIPALLFIRKRQFGATV